MRYFHSVKSLGNRRLGPGLHGLLKIFRSHRALCHPTAFWAGLVLLAGCADKPVPESIQARRVDALFSWATNGPGAVVAVVDHGDILLEKAYGFADVKKKIPLTARSAFDLASVSKQFTAMGIMILAERAQLSYDDSLCRYFPEFSPFGCDITIRNLLNHTSGLPDYEEIFRASGLIQTNYPRAARDAGDTFEPASKDALRFIANEKKLRFKPGDQWEYSDSGYVVLAQIIEKVSGKTYADFLRENIFRPAGMTETVVYDETRPVIPNRALSYSTNRPGPVDYTPLNLIYGDGNVHTTISDMIQWVRALDNGTLVTAPTLRQALTRGRLNNGKEFDYGFGWGIHNRHGGDVTEHGGSWVGFRSSIVRLPRWHLSIIILSNSGRSGLGDIAQKIESIYLFGEAPD
jgi:CubicO group peptidase (beta-lactamase class C family)